MWRRIGQCRVPLGEYTGPDWTMSCTPGCVCGGGLDNAMYPWVSMWGQIGQCHVHGCVCGAGLDNVMCPWVSMWGQIGQCHVHG